MGEIGDTLGRWWDYAPLLFALVVTASALAVARTALYLREKRTGAAPGVRGNLLMLALTSAGLLVVVLSLPVSEQTRQRLLALLGLAFTAVITFSSTTFVANAMAGLMLRAVRNFRPGDFIRVADHFGRVTERGLFHTEIQTEHSDLATLPNLYLATNPVTVVRESGTIVHAVLSLGYDLPHGKIEKLLVQAATSAGLEDPFVHILELGDFSVQYRISGFLREVKQLLSARSRLRTCVLDTLHGAGVEIVSPTFMNQRRLGDGVRVVPPVQAPAAAPTNHAEEIVFDKAEESASLEALRAERAELVKEIEELGKPKGSDEEKAQIQAEIDRRRARVEAIEAELEPKD